jgi:FixJ family two-component response regulator
MVIDDEPDLLATTKMLLEKEGYKVHGFTNPITGLSHVENGCKECIIVISDIRMPGMSGFELVRRLKELPPEMKVIFMTAFKINMEEAQMVLPSTKVEAFLNKPFRTTELMEAIKECNKQPN